MLRKIKDQNKWRDSVYGSEDSMLLGYQLFQTDLQIQCNLIKMLVFAVFFLLKKLTPPKKIWQGASKLHMDRQST